MARDGIVFEQVFEVVRRFGNWRTYGQFDIFVVCFVVYCLLFNGWFQSFETGLSPLT